jgi:hypothetical protein
VGARAIEKQLQRDRSPLDRSRTSAALSSDRGYLYGITSERKLVEELRMHLAWRWFTGLGFDQGLPLMGLPPIEHICLFWTYTEAPSLCRSYPASSVTKEPHAAGTVPSRRLSSQSRER